MPPLLPPYPTNLQNRINELGSLVNAAGSAHYRLVWLVGDTSSDRSALLRIFTEAEGCHLLNVGRDLSQALLDVPASLRAASVEECFADLLESADGNPVCLDRLEILFEPSLKLYPSDLVKNASRHRSLIASWPGGRDADSLSFGPESHPAHRRIAFEQLECQFLDIAS